MILQKVPIFFSPEIKYANFFVFFLLQIRQNVYDTLQMAQKGAEKFQFLTYNYEKCYELFKVLYEIV